MIGCVTALPVDNVNTTNQLCSIVNRVHCSFRYVTRYYYLNKELCSIVNRVHCSFRKSPQESSNNQHKNSSSSYKNTPKPSRSPTCPCMDPNCIANSRSVPQKAKKLRRNKHKEEKQFFGRILSLFLCCIPFEL